MAATTGGRPNTRAKARQGFKRKPVVRKKPKPVAPKPDVTLGGDRSRRTGHSRATTPKPAAQGHPGRGSSGTAGGTKKNPRTRRYKSKTPSVRKQRAARRRAIQRIRDSERWRTGRIEQSGVGDVLEELGKRTVTPAAEVLDQSTRVGEFVTGGLNQQAKSFKKGDVAGAFNPVKNIKAGYESGVTRKKRVHGDDLLKTVGVKNKTVQTVGGLLLDIGLDPVTYATAGTGAGVKGAAKAAAKVGEKAEVEALAKGASRKAAKKAKSKASRKKFAETPKNKGISVGVGKRRTSGKASAFVARKTGLNKVRVGPSRESTAKAIPVRPAGMTEKEWGRLKAADRERRGIIMHGTRRVARRGRAIRKEVGERKRFGKKRIPEETSARIRDAIEKRDLSDLLPSERRAAEALMREQEKLLDMRRKAGERASRYTARSEDEPKGYVYRQSAKEIDGGKPKRGQPPRRTTTLKDFQRGDRRPMATVREVSPGKYVEDIETTLRVKGQKDVTRAANTKFRGRVMEMGRTLKPSSKWDPETEGIYAVRDGRLVDVSKETFAKGEVVILKREVADNANQAMEATGRLKFIDPVTNAVKWVLTVPNPQYWARNAYGGTYMAWQSGVRGDAVFRNTPTAVRLNRRIRKQHHAEESLTKQMPKGGRVKVLPNGGTMDMNEFIDELERVNISGGGQTTELLGAEFRRRGKAQGAEDFPRLLAYIHWRRQGHSPEESARLTLNSQFDYGDATKFERQWAKRIIPFWTFRSRNVVHQGKTVVTRPGKFATTEKIRDTLAQSAGLPEGWQDALQEGEKAQVPIPTPFEVEVPGLGKQSVLLFPGLPVTDLNLYTFNPAALGQQVGSSIHPLAKAVIEFTTNYNFFWRDKIESEGNRWTAAPDELIDKLPTPARKELIDAGIIRMGKDRWTGKWSWQWRGKADYLAKLTPLTSVGFAQLTSSLSRKGQSSNMRALGWLTGIRPMPFNPKQGAYDRLLKELKKLETRKSDLEELGTHKKKGWDRQENSGESGWDSPEYARVKDRLERMYEMKYKLEGQLGKKDRAVPQSLNQNKDEDFFGDVKDQPKQKFFDDAREESKGGFFDDVR